MEKDNIKTTCARIITFYVEHKETIDYLVYNIIETALTS